MASEHAFNFRLMIFLQIVEVTPAKTSMEPKNGGLEDDFPFQLGYFRFHVDFQGCMMLFPEKWHGFGPGSSKSLTE